MQLNYSSERLNLRDYHRGAPFYAQITPVGDMRAMLRWLRPRLILVP